MKANRKMHIYILCVCVVAIGVGASIELWHGGHRSINEGTYSTDESYLMTNQEYLSLRTVRGTEVPGETLMRWNRDALDAIKPGSSRLNLNDPSDEMVFRIRSDETVVDLIKSNVTDKVRSACVESNTVRWLRLPPNSSAAELNWVSRMKRLRGLALTHADLADANLSELESLTELEWLEISQAKVGPLVASTLPRLPSLQSLSIKGEDTTDATIVKLTADTLPHLRTLSIGYSRITERSVEWVAKEFKLEYLSIFGLELSQRSIDSLGSMNSLLLLDIIATEGQANMIRQRLPNCIVSAE